VGTVARALGLGYAGSSRKNCEGVFKGVANGILLANLPGAIQTAEDLANIGPVALLQDLAIVGLLRVPDVERNGHHYFRGLSPFPPNLGEAVLVAHPDLYEALSDGTATLETRRRPARPWLGPAGAVRPVACSRAAFGTGGSPRRFAVHSDPMRLILTVLSIFASGALADYRPVKLDPPAPSREFRAAWVASIWNVDWPSKPGLSSDKQRQELISILDVAAQTNLNAIILQVRPEADALYESKLEPWSYWLTGSKAKLLPTAMTP